MTFLIDIGNVLLTFDFHSNLKRFLENKSSDLDIAFETVIQRKDEFEAGRISQDAYFNWTLKKLNLEVAYDDFICAWNDIFTPNLPMWKTVEQLKAHNHRLILFSNINPPHREYILKKYPVFDAFDGAIFSYETGHIKPEPEIYQHAIEKHQLAPDEVVYIDDMPANIDAGKKFGFTCHLYDHAEHSSCEKWLKSQELL